MTSRVSGTATNPSGSHPGGQGVERIQRPVGVWIREVFEGYQQRGSSALFWRPKDERLKRVIQRAVGTRVEGALQAVQTHDISVRTQSVVDIQREMLSEATFIDVRGGWRSGSLIRFAILSALAQSVAKHAASPVREFRPWQQAVAKTHEAMQCLRGPPRLDAPKWVQAKLFVESMAEDIAILAGSALPPLGLSPPEGYSAVSADYYDVLHAEFLKQFDVSEQGFSSTTSTIVRQAVQAMTKTAIRKDHEHLIRSEVEECARIADILGAEDAEIQSGSEGEIEESLPTQLMRAVLLEQSLLILRRYQQTSG